VIVARGSNDVLRFVLGLSTLAAAGYLGFPDFDGVAAVIALTAAGRSRLAIVLAVLVAVHLTLTFPLRQRAV
jgi:hypothetical protein